MKDRGNMYLKCAMFVVACAFITACEKEHLQPVVPAGASQQPLVYISAIIAGDTIHYEGGVNSYVGEVAVIDTNISAVTCRYFTFFLYSELSTTMQPKPYFKICINNARSVLGPPQQDLDSSVFASVRNYQYYGSPTGFDSLDVTLDWYDSVGTKYTTSYYPQSGMDTFKLTSVEEISFNNKTYKKVTAEFSCMLMNENFTNSMQLANGRATIIFGTD